MFISSRFVNFFLFFFLINLIKCKKSFPVKCFHSNKALDQKHVRNETTNRHKRFVLFPEFKLWLNDWRYLNYPKHFRYWISNYYPQKIHSNLVQIYIHQIINDINQYIHNEISSIDEALLADESNFNYNFFNYEICPTDDSKATIEDVDNVETLLIYPKELVKKNRYRAHGGISLNYKDNSTRSNMKFNVHHNFLFYQDFQYDPVIYTCNQDESQCTMDMYAVMLHETLHGFGIEHTEVPLPNKNIRAVMHLYASRIMCHDDIRAIRMVYGLSVKRSNAKYDDTCRRDFPMNKLQKIMWKIHKWIYFYGFIYGFSISFTNFLFTIIYIILKKYFFNCDNFDSRSSIDSDYSESSQYKKQHKSAINAFLWHNDL